jgi:hypothetical protein
VFLIDPPVPASRSVLAMFLGAGPLEVVYAGDRMAPAVKSGDRVMLERCGDRDPAAGEVVVVADGGVVDLFRVDAIDGTRLVLGADADPSEPRRLPRDAAIARARIPDSTVGSWTRRRRRLGLDLREAWDGRPDAEGSATVLEKYETQAPHYARGEGPALEPRLEARVRSRVPEGGSILVVGSGAGRETLALARAGFRARGIDFAPAMVAASRAAAAQAGVAATFEAADLRAHAEPPASLDAVLFTYDVYSFVPGASARISALRRIASWLRPGGTVYLSARRTREAWSRCLLAIQRLRGAGELGDSHTRWFGVGGSMRRSYVHVFTEATLRREIEAAGGRCVAWEGGHGEIVFGEGR